MKRKTKPRAYKTKPPEPKQCSRCEQLKADWRVCPLCKLTYCSNCFYSHFAYCHTLIKKQVESTPKINRKATGGLDPTRQHPKKASKKPAKADQ